MTKKTKPIFEKRVKNVRLQLWRNVSKQGKKFVLIKIWVYRFPFKFNQSITLALNEIDSLREVLDLLPEIVIKEKCQEQ